MLRNIGYMRFGSKIRQGFAGGITSLTPPLSLSPLWIPWAENEDAREGAELLYLWREPAAPLPPHHLAAGGLPRGRGPAARQQGGRPPPKTSAQIKFIFIYIEVPTAPGR